MAKIITSTIVLILIILMITACKDRAGLKFKKIKEDVEKATPDFDPNYTQKKHWALVYEYVGNKNLVENRAKETRFGPMPTLGKSGELEVIMLNSQGQKLFSYRVPSPFTRIDESEQKLIEFDEVKFIVLAPQYVRGFGDSIVTTVQLKHPKFKDFTTSLP